jgi:hypothetical protein
MYGASIIGLAAVGGTVGCMFRVFVRDAFAAAGLTKWQAILLMGLHGGA